MGAKLRWMPHWSGFHPGFGSTGFNSRKCSYWCRVEQLQWGRLKRAQEVSSVGGRESGMGWEARVQSLLIPVHSCPSWVRPTPWAAELLEPFIAAKSSAVWWSSLFFLAKIFHCRKIPVLLASFVPAPAVWRDWSITPSPLPPGPPLRVLGRQSHSPGSDKPSSAALLSAAAALHGPHFSPQINLNSLNCKNSKKKKKSKIRKNIYLC